MPGSRQAKWRGVWLFGANRLRDGWVEWAETWWDDQRSFLGDDRGHMRERPHQG